MSEGTCLLEAEKPCDPRNRHAIFLEIAGGQACLELLHNLVKCHAFFSKPSCQRPLAHPKLLGDDVSRVLGREEARVEIVFSTVVRNLPAIALASLQALFADFEKDFVQMRIGVDSAPIPRSQPGNLSRLPCRQIQRLSRESRANFETPLERTCIMDARLGKERRPVSTEILGPSQRCRIRSAADRHGVESPNMSGRSVGSGVSWY